MARQSKYGILLEKEKWEMITHALEASAIKVSQMSEQETWGNCHTYPPKVYELVREIKGQLHIARFGSGES